MSTSRTRPAPSALKPAPSGWLALCRAGFETECAEELVEAAEQRQLGGEVHYEEGDGYVRFQADGPAPKLASLSLSSLVFARQLILTYARVDLPERNRLTPLTEALAELPAPWLDLWLEYPDSEQGKTLSGFTRRFDGYLRDWIAGQKELIGNDRAPTLHIFFPSLSSAWLGVTLPGQGSAWPLGIPRLKMPAEAPSRSTLKLSEAMHSLLTPEELQQRMKDGMRAVDLGAAPGGWTFQLLSRGLRVTAVDNGPLKGVVAGHPWVRHQRVDGFRFRPEKPVDWVVCDMVEQPARVAKLMSDWLADGHAREAIFNLKLPMKKRWLELTRCKALIEGRLQAAGMPFELRVKQLYHDREEVTCYLRRIPQDRQRRR